ncbi:MAG: hypothetical protein HDR02_01715 [Lachnospiraceae bacterium]|nr:hypothetical protein [Lachnospiraceae bacterium]
MLNTPLGEIEIYIDGRAVAYEEYPLSYDETCPDLSGRYRINIDFVPDGASHSIACLIKGHISNDSDCVESGERLECKGFYSGTVKVSIGMEGDRGCGGRKSVSGYDYENEYLDNGVEYVILPFTKTRRYVFGIAWIEGAEGERDVQTWFGADVTEPQIIE